jgi:uncharacterized protein involved in type VI secretion and phage assembly
MAFSPFSGSSALLGREIAHRVHQQQRRELDLDGYRDPMIGHVHQNQDPQKLGRVKVKIDALEKENDKGEKVEFITDWAQLIVPGAGENRGWFFIPEVNDEVLVMFRDGEPLIVGALWGKDEPPDKNPDGDNPRRSIKSRSGSQVIFNDAGDVIVIKDGAGKACITLDAANNVITIEALQGDVCFQSPKGEMKISAQSAELKATKNIEIHSGGEMKWTSNAGITLGNSNVDLSGMKSDLGCGSAQASPPSPPSDTIKVKDPYGS